MEVVEGSKVSLEGERDRSEPDAPSDLTLGERRGDA
jgi:hypothetical protein